MYGNAVQGIFFPDVPMYVVTFPTDLVVVTIDNFLRNLDVLDVQTDSLASFFPSFDKEGNIAKALIGYAVASEETSYQLIMRNVRNRYEVASTEPMAIIG